MKGNKTYWSEEEFFSFSFLNANEEKRET